MCPPPSIVDAPKGEQCGLEPREAFRVLRYAFGSLLIAVAMIAGLFTALARFNGPRASSGPLPAFVLRVDDAAVTPARIDLREDQLAELRLVNNGSALRMLSTDADNVQQLPVESPFFSEHAGANGVPYIRLEASPGTTASALVRFKDAGDYELRIEVPGDPATLRVVQVTVD